MFGYGLFLDSVLCTAEQDISKHQSAAAAPGPGTGTSQRSNWRGNFRYRPYERRDTHRGSGQTDKDQQPWHQFLEIDTEAVDVVEVQIFVFQSQETSNHTNDNNSVVSTKLNLNLTQIGPSSRSDEPDCKLFSVRQAVSCLDVVTHVPTVILHGQPQMKVLVSLVQKQAVQRVVVKSSLAFYNRLFFLSQNPTENGDQSWI